VGRQTVLSLSDAEPPREARARVDGPAHAIERRFTANEQRRLAQTLGLLQRLANA
jgi:hypothetical protein